MTPAWAQRQEALVRDCVVSPDVFTPMVDRLRDFVRPYQYVRETEAGKRHVSLYLAGLLSHLPRKNAEDIATLVEVERQPSSTVMLLMSWSLIGVLAYGRRRRRRAASRLPISSMAILPLAVG
jgi:hypothetical protein